MIYQPLLASGQYEHFRPLWKLLAANLPQMKATGKQFFGVDGALLLPHATDDKGHVSGKFWAGLLDQACVAWMGQMAWQYYGHTGDTNHLRSLAYPLLVGAFEGYRAMMTDSIGTNGQHLFKLPVTVSPEWRGSQMSAVGANASFQLAACHSVCRALPEAARALGLPVDPRWAEVVLGLPAFALVESPKVLEYPQYSNKRIGLFDGQDLIESHRHHSHLAGIYPFLSLNPSDTTGRQNGIISNSLNNWVLKGQGHWTGWSYPWASILASRMDCSDKAVALLHEWNDKFVNEGRGTLHDGLWPGATIRFQRGDSYRDVEAGRPNREIMQLDARMGAVTAVQELLMQERAEGLVVLPQVPRKWKNLAFENLRASGGFKISGWVANNKLVEVRVEATRPGLLKLKNPIGPELLQNDTLLTNRPDWLTLKAETGDTWTFRAKGTAAHKPDPWINWNPSPKMRRIVHPD
jgi:hypothetical protein